MKRFMIAAASTLALTAGAGAAIADDVPGAVEATRAIGNEPSGSDTRKFGENYPSYSLDDAGMVLDPDGEMVMDEKGEPMDEDAFSAKYKPAEQPFDLDQDFALEERKGRAGDDG